MLLLAGLLAPSPPHLEVTRARVTAALDLQDWTGKGQAGKGADEP
jgi:hypothetical protein